MPVPEPPAPGAVPGGVAGGAVYLEGGVRAAGLGLLAFGERDPGTGELRSPPWEYLRLAVPRRVYTDNHIAYAASVLQGVWAKREEVPGRHAVSRLPRRR